MKNIEFWGISWTQKYSCNLLKAVLDKRLSLSSMFHDSYRFNIFMFMFANEILPYKSHADHRDKSCDVFHVAHVGVLDVESGSLHDPEGSLNIPPLLISENRAFRTIETV